MDRIKEKNLYFNPLWLSISVFSLIMCPYLQSSHTNLLTPTPTIFFHLPVTTSPVTAQCQMWLFPLSNQYPAEPWNCMCVCVCVQ